MKSCMERCGDFLPQSRPVSNISIFITFILINLLNFVDRGIIPGSTVEFDDFIRETTNTSSPDALLGFLQSSFIVGFVIGSLIFGHYVHYYGKFLLIRVGIGIWIVAVFLSGLSQSIRSYYFLLFARMLSGFSEASIQCTMPPWIQANAPQDKRGLWLSIFYTVFPVGTAIGYTYSSMMSTSIGWQWAFFGEVMVMLPVYFYLYIIPLDHVHHEEVEEGEAIVTEAEGAERSDSVASSTTSSKRLLNKPPTMWEELVLLCSIEFYDYIIVGNAAQTAVLIGLSTFGSAFFMSLGFYDTESDASTMFGVLVSVAGILGVPLGGWCIDYMCKRKGLVLPSDEEEIDNLASESSKSGIEVTSPLAQEARDEQNLLHTTASSSSNHNNNQAVTQKKKELSKEIPSSQETYKLLDIITIQLFWSSLVGSVLLCILYSVTNKGLYLFFIVIGCLLLFFTYTGIFMAVMNSIPEANRSFGMAFCAIIGHALGDVPSPIFVGWLKDELAPDCVGSDDDDGNIAASEECRNDDHGLRVCFLLICLWLFWSVFFFGIAWYRNYIKIKKDSNDPVAEEKRDFSRQSY